MSEQETGADWATAADRVPIDQTEPADGVKVGGASNYFSWYWPEEPPDDTPQTPLFPWAGFVWAVLLIMACAAAGAMVAGR